MTTAAASPLRAGPVFGLIAAISVFAITMGITYPLLSLQLEAAGYSKTLIGVSAGMTPLGMIASAPFMSRLMRRFHPVPILLAANLATAAILMCLASSSDYGMWLVLRFILGITINAIHTVGETALQSVIPAHQRGRFMGLYNALLTLAFVVGPAVLSVTGSAGWLPFVIGAVLVVVASLPLVGLKARTPGLACGAQERAASPIAFVRIAPILLLVYAVVATFDNSGMALIPLFAMEHGFTEATATNFLAIVMVGGMLMQFPIGLLADRWGTNAVMLACSIAVVGGCLALPATIDLHGPAWIVGFLWGGAAFGVYTMALTELGRRFSGAQLAAGNIAFGFSWGVSAALGIPAAGSAMEHLGPNGFMLTIGALFTLVAVCYAGKVLFASDKKAAASYA